MARKLPNQAGADRIAAKLNTPINQSLLGAVGWSALVVCATLFVGKLGFVGGMLAGIGVYPMVRDWVKFAKLKKEERQEASA
jgi:hypothetical protein